MKTDVKNQFSLSVTRLHGVARRRHSVLQRFPIAHSGFGKFWLFVACLLLGASMAVQAQISGTNGIVYVDNTQSGNGSSWASAYPNLSDPLILAARQRSGAIVVAPTDTIQAIYVAEGTYIPMYTASGYNFTNKVFPSTDGTRNNAFVLVPGVKIYGGFASSFPAAGIIPDFGTTGRDGLTILSGDRGIVGDSTDNCYHVLLGVNISASSGTVIDGVTISGGYGDVSSSIAINGSGIERNYGGGMYNYNSSPTLTNATISGNSASNAAGGMFNNYLSSPTLANVTISGNFATYGGGIYNLSSSPTLTNATISGNSASNAAGGIYDASSSPTYTNVTISGNSAAVEGGGMYISYSASPTFTNVIISGNSAPRGGGMTIINGASPTLTNVTISGNSAPRGGGMYISTSSPKIYNSIIWGNRQGLGDNVYNMSSTPVYDHSLLEGATIGSGIISNANPLFVNWIDPSSATIPNTLGDYSLQMCSPAIDVGDTTLYKTARGIADFIGETDLVGNPRLMNSNIDLGAYEVQSLIPTFNIIASAGADGSISPNGTATVNCGGNKTFILAPAICYEIDTLFIDGSPVLPDSVVSGTGYYTFGNVTANGHTIHITFKKIQYAIVASAGADGSISPSGTVSVICGDDQTFTFSPTSCYEIDTLFIDGSPALPDSVVSGTGYYTFGNVTANGHTIHSTFKKIPYAIVASAGADGSISPSGTTTVACGDDQTYTFFPVTPCYIIDTLWIDGSPALPDSVVSGTGYYTFSNVIAGHTIDVTFAPDPLCVYTITATTDGNGSIIPGGSVGVNEHDDQLFYFTPNTCYEVDSLWVGGVYAAFDSVMLGVGYFTIEDVVCDSTIHVSFRKIEYTITSSSGLNGSISPGGSVAVNCGEDRTFTFASATSCYEIDTLWIDGSPALPDSVVSGTGYYTFGNVTSDGHTIDVTFKRTSYTITASAGINGGISPAGTVTVYCGEDQTFTFAANSGYEIDRLLIDAVDVPDSIAGGSYTFVNVTGNHSISVTFREISVTGVDITNCPAQGWIHLNSVMQMDMEIIPPDAANKNVLWKSSNPNTAIVDQSGKVKAMSVGATIITATTEDGGFVASCYIKVVVPVAGIWLNKESLSLLVNEEAGLVAYVVPEHAGIKDVIWTSVYDSIATVDNNGIITGVSPGVTVITATTVDGSFSAGCTVTVANTYVPATGIAINPKTLSIDIGKTFLLEAVLSPVGANPTVTWSSSSPAIATVDGAGLVTALAAGKATITAKTANNYSAACAVTVTIGIDSILIVPDSCTIPLKGAKALKATVYPSNATNKTLAWSSSDASIATVSTTGTVTAKNANGEVEIYATNVASGKVGVCVVTVGSGKNAPTETDFAGDIVVYPNPTTGELKIENGELKIENIEILDLLGRQQLSTLNSQLSTQIDISHLPTGIYFIRIKTEEGVVTRRVVKQ